MSHLLSHRPFIKIMGIDPGSLLCGFSSILLPRHFCGNVRSVQVEDFGVIKLNRKHSFNTRTQDLHQTLRVLFDEHQPDIVVLEQAFLGLNTATALKLGQIRGAVMAAVGQSASHIGEITPAQVKKSVAGSGRASKEQIAETLSALLNVSLGRLSHDATDALAIALAYSMLNSHELLNISSLIHDKSQSTLVESSETVI